MGACEQRGRAPAKNATRSGRPSGGEGVTVTRCQDFRHSKSKLTLPTSLPHSPRSSQDHFDLGTHLHEERETVEALKLQKPLPDGMLDVVARGEEGRSAGRGSVCFGEQAGPAQPHAAPNCSPALTPA